MPRHLLRAAAAGVVALVGGLLTAPSASADIRTFPDVGGHITAVRVSHGPATVGVTAYDDDLDAGTYYHFWLDTHSTNPGPEYKAEIYPGSDVLHLMRVANFASSGIKFDCEGFHGFANVRTGYAKVIIPRSCIGVPGRIRVAVTGFYPDPDPVGEDWAPGEERFYPWVNR